MTGGGGTARHRSRPHTGIRRQSGLTLAELLVALMILGLLAGFGVPMLLAHGIKSQRLAAINVLRQISRKEAPWFIAHRDYASLSQLGYAVDSERAAIYLGGDGSVSGSANRDSTYRITVVRKPADAQAGTMGYFLATATPINKQAGDTRCGTLSLASTGQIGSSGSLGEGLCWRG